MSCKAPSNLSIHVRLDELIQKLKYINLDTDPSLVLMARSVLMEVQDLLRTYQNEFYRVRLAGMGAAHALDRLRENHTNLPIGSSVEEIVSSLQQKLTSP